MSHLKKKKKSLKKEFHHCKNTFDSLPEVSSLVSELVVEQGAGMFVGAVTQVTDIWPLI